MKIFLKIAQVFSLMVLSKMLSGCFLHQPNTPEDLLNKKEFRKLPDSEIVFVAKYVGTQTGTQLYFRKDSIFTLQSQSIFGWEQYNGKYNRIEASDTFSLTYFNEHLARWKYVVIKGDKALFKQELTDTIRKQSKSFKIIMNLITTN